MNRKKIILFPEIKKQIKTILKQDIEDDRLLLLNPLIRLLKDKIQLNENIKLNFICTHNSRRSQFSQIWAKTAAHYFGYDVETFSGGTEVTELNKKVVASLIRSGFRLIEKGETNPYYFIFYSEDADPIVAFSKKIDDQINPIDNFIAVMTCDQAHESCPVVHGAKSRILLTYKDPKIFDGTQEESSKYDERSLQIAAEMFHLFSSI
ncbi:MAG TPA: protein-tyrosine-phosphatase [Saprospiraceae bacterium]|nr:protein-tyrosine-phosphatase [Saprospiraceae bacterium]